MASLFSTIDYRNAHQALMPRGPVWPREPDAVQTAVLTGLSASYQRNDAAAVRLLTDAFPGTADALLPEWEASLGLPDAVAGPAPTVEKRRRAVMSRLVGSYGPSAAGMKSLAAAFGFNLALTPVAPFRAGQSAAGQPAASPAWAFALVAKVAPMAAPPFADPIGAWDAAFVASGLRALVPAHQTLVLIS